MSRFFGNSEGFRVFRFGEQDGEAEEFQRESGWKRVWCLAGTYVKQDSWVVYRDIDSLPLILRDYARDAERYGDSWVYYDSLGFGLRGTGASLFYRAKNSQLNSLAAYSKVQEILRGPQELQYDRAYYLDLLKEVTFGDSKEFVGQELTLASVKIMLFDFCRAENIVSCSLEDGSRFSFCRLRDDITFSVKSKDGDVVVSEPVAFGEFLYMSLEEVHQIRDELCASINKTFDAKLMDATQRSCEGSRAPRAGTRDCMCK